MNRLTKSERQARKALEPKMAKMRRAGKSFREIGVALGFDATSVMRYLRRMGIETAPAQKKQ
jgi:hypothetical protein